jgi:hypothetical protein
LREAHPTDFAFDDARSRLSSGNMFLSTGIGTFDDTSSAVPPLAPNNDFGESFVNLRPSTLAVQDFYTPSQNAAWSNSDLDISSGGIIVLPDGMGPWLHPNLLVGTDNGSAARAPAILRAYDATNLATTLYSSATLPADTAGNAGKFVSPLVANGHVYVVGSGTLFGLLLVTASRNLRP